MQPGYAVQCCHLKADSVVGVQAALQVSRALAVYHNTAPRSPAPHSQHSALGIVCKILLLSVNEQNGSTLSRSLCIT